MALNGKKTKNKEHLSASIMTAISQGEKQSAPETSLCILNTPQTVGNVQ
jgi:hypothetical protein